MCESKTDDKKQSMCEYSVHKKCVPKGAPPSTHTKCADFPKEPVCVAFKVDGKKVSK